MIRTSETLVLAVVNMRSNAPVQRTRKQARILTPPVCMPPSRFPPTVYGEVFSNSAARRVIPIRGDQGRARGRVVYRETLTDGAANYRPLPYAPD